MANNDESDDDLMGNSHTREVCEQGDTLKVIYQIKTREQSVYHVTNLWLLVISDEINLPNLSWNWDLPTKSLKGCPPLVPTVLYMSGKRWKRPNIFF